MLIFFHFVIIVPLSESRLEFRLAIGRLYHVFPSNILEGRTRGRHQVQTAPHAENMVSTKIFHNDPIHYCPPIYNKDISIDNMDHRYI